MPLLIVACHLKSSLSPITMAPTNILKCKETELECKMGIFDQTKSTINEAILDQALVLQAKEQVQCMCLQGEVTEEGRTTVHTRSTINLSPQEFMKAWKKIRSGKENKEWNGMEWEVHSYISPSIPSSHHDKF